MNLTEQKLDFYERFKESSNFLVYSRAGLICPLLGDIDTRQCPSLSCALSMRVQVYGRKLGGGMIKLENTGSNICSIYRFGDNPINVPKSMFEVLEKIHNLGAGGAEILTDSSVPEFLDDSRELKTAIVSTLVRLYSINISNESFAHLCACGGSEAPFTAALMLKKGYCVSLPEQKKLPLPLTGFKIVAAQCNKPDKRMRDQDIEKGFNILKRIYPHITSLADLSSQELEFARNHIKDKTLLNHLRHIVDENTRIKDASEGLKKCDINALATQMMISEQSIERLCSPEKQHVFLAERMCATDGVLCARLWKKGIISIVREENVDYAVDKIIREFEHVWGYKPKICIADSFGD